MRVIQQTLVSVTPPLAGIAKGNPSERRGVKTTPHFNPRHKCLATDS